MGRQVPDVRPLLVLAAVVSALALLGAVPTWAGLPHHLALPPLDLFADVRVLVAEAPSYPAFVAQLVAVLAVRAVALAAMLGVLDRAGVQRCLAFYGLALVPALAAGGLAFAGEAAVYSMLLWSAVAVSVVVALVLAPLPWRRRERAWSGRLEVLAYLAALLVVSLASTLGGGGVRIVLVWVTAGSTALVVRWLAGREEPDRPRPAAGTALALLVAVPLLVPVPSPGEGAAGERAAGERAAGELRYAGEPREDREDREGTLLLVPGIGAASGTSSLFRLDPGALGFDCEQTAYFSYAGPGDGAPRRGARCPITRGAPYESEDTHRPLGELAASFRAQLAELNPPVVVVAHSQGGWIATAALDGAAARRGVDAVVLMGAFPGHRQSYVLDGDGPGTVGTDALEGLMAALRAVDGTSFDPRGALPRQVLGSPGAVDDLMDAGFPPGVRVATVTSALDLPIMPRDRRLAGAADLCPLYVHHGSLPESGAVHRQVRDFLDGHDEGRCGWWRRWPTQAFSAFGVPGS